MVNLLLICGGNAGEHEVSLRSAQTVVNYLDKTKYHLMLVVIDKQSDRWFMHQPETLQQAGKELEATAGKAVYLAKKQAKPALYKIEDDSFLGAIDVAFPLVHGPYGEDGRLQGFLAMFHLPFVGSDVLASACAMDKDIARQLFAKAGLNIARGLTLIAGGVHARYNDLVAQLGPVLFVKPANMGSSVGISKVSNEHEYDEALKLAFQYDAKIIVEEALSARELECAVLGHYNETLELSPIGEIAAANFYTYEEKYANTSSAELTIPAQLSTEQQKLLHDVARTAYKALNCRGLARVDMFLTANNKIYVNEINTLPGFTSISMYPKLWLEAGLSLTELIDKLILLA